MLYTASGPGCVLALLLPRCHFCHNDDDDDGDGLLNLHQPQTATVCKSEGNLSPTPSIMDHLRFYLLWQLLVKLLAA